MACTLPTLARVNAAPASNEACSIAARSGSDVPSRYAQLQMREDGHDGVFREQARLLRVVKAAQVRLDRVRQRVHAGLRRDVWRQPDGQARGARIA